MTTPYPPATLQELEEQRASRFVPSEPNLLIDFFLETEADEMDYEIARCRNLLDDEFFKTLATNISIEKMRPQADEDRLAELEGLQMYLVSGVRLGYILAIFSL